MPASPRAGRQSDDPVEAARRIVRGARREGRVCLLEHEGLALVEALGLRAPERVVVAADGTPPPDDALPAGARLAVKTLSPSIAHKSDVGAVRIVPRDALRGTLAQMAATFAAPDLAGFLIEAFVPHDAAPGAELLVGLRTTADFGPVVTLGLGGVHAELLARRLAPGSDAAIYTPELDDPAARERAGRGVAAVELATRPQRGRPPRVPPEAFDALLDRWLQLAAAAPDLGLAELEVNPLVATDDGLVALDALGRLTDPVPDAARGDGRAGDDARGVRVGGPAGLGALFRPGSIAIAGVSRRANPGRIILENVLGDGFSPERVVVLKPGAERVLGCRAVPGLEELDAPVDLLVVAVAAGAAAELVERAAREGRARSILLVPGGFGEHAAGAAHAARVADALRASRARPDGGPRLLGGNCLGLRSRPGRFDTLFIPRHKLAFGSGGSEAPLAVLSQSGAFAVAWASRLGALDPRYVATFGNQVDVSLVDALEYLAGDPAVRVFACAVEGFPPGDGARFVRIARRLAAEGRPVVLYRAGRTAAGRRASAGHTASIAGDAAVCRALAEAAGAVVAETLDAFADLATLFVRLAGKRVDGLRLGAMSNAGFECVAIADAAGPFELPALAPPTVERLGALLSGARLDGIVAPRNPLDVTPMLDDARFAEAARILLDDPGVDVGIVGCVPLTGALSTLAPGPGHAEDAAAEGAVAARLAALFRASTKAWVAVVDGGPAYDAMARRLADGGVPVLRRADRALARLARVCGWRREHAPETLAGTRLDSPGARP